MKLNIEHLLQLCDSRQQQSQTSQLAPSARPALPSVSPLPLTPLDTLLLRPDALTVDRVEQRVEHQSIMAHNHSYSQPYYGFPHGYPPPQMQPSAPPDEQTGAPRMHPPPPTQNVPRLAPVLPGINLGAYAQNSQMPPFPARKLSPRLPSLLRRRALI